MLYISRSTRNRVKVCCIDGKNFTNTTDYVFTFSNRACCYEYLMTLKGDYCGECAEFYFEEACDGLKDIALPVGLYSLSIVSALDNTILFYNDQIRVQ